MAIIIVLVILCGGFFLLRLLYDRYWNRGLSCKLSFTREYADEDDISTLTEVLTNRNFLPLPAVEIDFHMDRRLRFDDGHNTSVSDQSYRRDVFSLWSHQRITRTLDFKCAGRGYFRIESAGVTGRDLFLTRKYLSSCSQNTDFYVLPRPVPAVKLEIPYAKIMGAVLSHKKIYDDPFEFAGLREYSRGDPMKYINWKATARAGEMLTNLHESTLSQTITFLIDMEGVGVQQADWLNEAAVRCAASLAEKLLKSGVDMNFYSNGKDVQTGLTWKQETVSGGGSVLFLRKRLACLEAENDLPPVCGCMPQSSTVGNGEEDLIVLFSRSQRPETMEQFSKLVGKGHGVYIIPFKVNHDELIAPKNIDLVWIEV